MLFSRDFSPIRRGCNAVIEDFCWRHNCALYPHALIRRLFLVPGYLTFSTPAGICCFIHFRQNGFELFKQHAQHFSISLAKQQQVFGHHRQSFGGPV